MECAGEIELLALKRFEDLYHTIYCCKAKKQCPLIFRVSIYCLLALIIIAIYSFGL